MNGEGEDVLAQATLARRFRRVAGAAAASLDLFAVGCSIVLILGSGGAVVAIAGAVVVAVAAGTAIFSAIRARA